MRARSTRLSPILSWPLAVLGVAVVSTPAHALEPFTDGSTALMNPGLSSGVAIGVTDMNGDSLDDLVRLDDADDLEIEYQQADGSFERYVFGNLPGSSQWGMALGDIDGNGFVDIFAGGAYNGLKILRANDEGTSFDLTTMDSPSVFTQCANFADIDNNGTLDLLVCHDDGIAAPLNNDGMGNFSYDLGLINPASTIPSDNSGNYGTVWTDYDSDGDLDLYIAKCRLGVANPMDGRRVNLLFQNDGDGNYTEVAEAAGLRPLAQSWAMDFADIDNDGDMDAFLINHDMLSQLYENQGPGAGEGSFVDITNGSGMTNDLLDIDLGIQAHFEDFDNDTFIDLLVTGRSGEHGLFMNNGDQTFSRDLDAFPTGGLGIQSAVIGDLDDNGFPDVLAGFATGFNNPSNSNPDRLFINPGNDNNWFNIRLTGVTSNTSAVGARVEIIGPWGTQIREVRAGEAYGITNSFIRHFGLGSADEIETVIVYWPSGRVDMIDDPNVVNRTVHMIEGCEQTWYGDADGDGFGTAEDTIGGCLPPQGYVEHATDCDDGDGSNYPDNEEICDEQDNNCDDEVDEGFEDGCEAAGTGTDTGAVDSSGGEEDSSGGGPGNSSLTGNSNGTSGPLDPTNGDGSSGDDAGADSDEGGCSCVASGSRGDMGLTLLALGLLFGVRRRRSRLGA